MTVVSTIEQLEAIYGVPNDASTVKVADKVTRAYRALMDKSPFAALATCGPEGLDCSPRGDLPGFVRVHDEKTLMMPDRRGNNRCDSLRNIVRDPGWRCCVSSRAPAARCASTVARMSRPIRNCSRRS